MESKLSHYDMDTVNGASITLRQPIRLPYLEAPVMQSGPTVNQDGDHY